MYLLQRSCWSYDSFAMWNELKAGSTDPVITTSLNLEILLASDGCFSYIVEKSTTWLERKTSLTKSALEELARDLLLFSSFVLSKRVRDNKPSGMYL